jgi:hypothetical protein
MSATLAASLKRPPTAADIDRLAESFLSLEAKADEAYKIAVSLDEPHERMREDLVCLVEEFGSTHAEKSKLLFHGEFNSPRPGRRPLHSLSIGVGPLFFSKQRRHHLYNRQYRSHAPLSGRNAPETFMRP